MDEASPQRRHVSCQPLTAEGFARFGMLIDPNGVTPEMINDGTTRRYSDLAALDLNTDAAKPKIGVYVSSARSFPLQIAKLERHRQSSQVFVPLGMHRFALVVAPGAESPELDGIAAFVTSPGQGVSLHRGTWHHSLIALGEGDRFIVIDGGNYRADTQEHTLVNPLWLANPLE